MVKEVTKESQELEPISRSVVLHFVRHGKAAYSEDYDTEGYLTEEGQAQAREAAGKLYEKLPEGVMVKFFSSNRIRARQTIDIISNEINNLSESGDKKLNFHGDKVKTFSHFGMSDPQTVEAIDVQWEKNINPIEFWLNNPGKSSEEIEKSFRGALDHLASFAHHLNPRGPDVHIIIGTHTGPAEFFLGRLLRRSTMPTLNNCEEFTVKLPADNRIAEIKFKDIDEKIEL